MIALWPTCGGSRMKCVVTTAPVSETWLLFPYLLRRAGRLFPRQTSPLAWYFCQCSCLVWTCTSLYLTVPASFFVPIALVINALRPSRCSRPASSQDCWSGAIPALRPMVSDSLLIVLCADVAGMTSRPLAGWMLVAYVIPSSFRSTYSSYRIVPALQDSLSMENKYLLFTRGISSAKTPVFYTKRDKRTK